MSFLRLILFTVLCGVLSLSADELDGINPLPYLTGELDTAPDRQLHRRWSAQSAVLDGNWKFLKGGPREYLFNLKDDREEQHNRIEEHLEIAKRLKKDLDDWSQSLLPPSLPEMEPKGSRLSYYDHYLDGKTVPPPSQAETSEKDKKPEKERRSDPIR